MCDSAIVIDFIAGSYYRIALPSPMTPIDRVKNKRALRNELQSMQKPMSRKRDRRPNLRRNTGNDTHILRPAAAPTRPSILATFGRYFVSDNRARPYAVNGISRGTI